MGTVNFKSYRDHSERERASLTEDDVKRMLDAELMIEGVLKPTSPPSRRDPKKMVLAARSVTCVRWNHGMGGVAFDSDQKAREFLALEPRSIDHAWDVDRHFTRHLADAKITVEDLPDEITVNESRSELAKIKAENEAADKARTEYEAQLLKVDRVTRGVWEDWGNQRDTLARMKKIQATFAEYLGMTSGDDDLAIKFLLKVFSADTVRDAALWTEDAGLADSLESHVEHHAGPPPPNEDKKLSAPVDDDIVF